MKNTFFAIAFLLPLLAVGQNDTLLFEDFSPDPSGAMALFPSGNDTVWVNFDADGEPPLDPNLPLNWYSEWSPFDNPDSSKNDVFASSSYLKNPSAKNDNWLILPPIRLCDNKASIHWKSAPFEGPAFMDGYFLMLSTTDNLEASFTTTLFGAAECTGYPPTPSVIPADFTFSPGYIHANVFADSQYFEFNGQTNQCKLEPHSYFLGDYADETVYLAFRHYSQDDNRLDLDDILVLGTNCTSPTADVGDFDIEPILYPNPVEWQLNVLFSLKKAENCCFSVMDEMGRTVFEEAEKKFPAGRNQWNYFPKGLAPGQFFLKVKTEGGSVSRAFSKQ